MIRRAALLAGLVLTSVSPAFLLIEEVPASVGTSHCQEDQPCWDWRTMGNRCGRDSIAEPVRCYR